MFFDKRDIEREQGQDVINGEVFLERVTEAIKEKLFFVPDYSYGQRVNKDQAEEFMLEMYSVLKRF